MALATVASGLDTLRDGMGLREIAGRTLPVDSPPDLASPFGA